MQEPMDAPEHTQRLNRTCRFGLTHVCNLPTELIKDFARDLLCGLVIAADKHCWPAALKFGIHHFLQYFPLYIFLKVQ